MKWKFDSLITVCNIQMGQAPPGTSYNEIGEGIPLIAGAGDFDGNIPNVKKFTTSPSKISESGDIILGIRASIGEKVWSDRSYCLGRGVAGLRPKSGLHSQYLWNWLNTAKPILMSKARGATFLQVNRNDIESLEIPLPPLAEQKRIAGILDAADALRAKRRESLAQLDTLLQSTFLDMFGDPVINPKCESSKLSDYLEFLTSGGRGWAKYYTKTGKRFIRSLDVQMNSISDEDVIYVTPPNNAEAKRTRVYKNDILLTITGSRIGRVSKIPDCLEGSYISQHVAIIRVNNKLIPEFLAHFLSYDNCGQIQIRKMQYGQTKPGLNFEQIQSLHILTPPIQKQKKFATIVEKVEKQKSRLRAHLAELDALFASLQSRAFNGEL